MTLRIGVVANTHNDSTAFTWNYTNGKLASTEDEAGSTTNFTWCPGCGALDSILGPMDGLISYSKDSEHKVTSFNDARDKHTNYAYGAAKEPLSTTYPDNSVESYTITIQAAWRVLQTAVLKRWTTPMMQPEELPLSVFPTTSETTQTFDWNLDGTLHQVTDAVGTTTYTYDDARKVTSVVYDYSASGLTTSQTVEYEYYTDQLLKKITWKEGTTTVATWQYSYDAAGHLTGLTSPGATASFSYDGQGKILSQINSNGTETSYIYNNDRGWPTLITHKSDNEAFEQFALTYDSSLIR